jgi:hypothetical protein
MDLSGPKKKKAFFSYSEMKPILKEDIKEII